MEALAKLLWPGPPSGAVPAGRKHTDNTVKKRYTMKNQLDASGATIH